MNRPLRPHRSPPKAPSGARAGERPCAGPEGAFEAFADRHPVAFTVAVFVAYAVLTVFLDGCSR